VLLAGALLASGAVIVAASLLGVVQAGASPSAVPPLEPVAVTRLPLAPGHSAEFQPDWLPDGRHIVMAFDAPDQPHAQLAVATATGTQVRCLTCGMDVTGAGGAPAGASVGFGKPFAFGDGRRILTTLEAQQGSPDSASQNFQYAIVECVPSVVSCRHRTLVPLHLPATGQVQNREARVSPDGRWLAWTQLRSDGTIMAMGQLDRGRSDYTLKDVRVLDAHQPLGSTSAAWTADSPYGEIKRFSSDGQSLFYATMADAENFDVWRVDLRTGKRTRVTTEPAWDEDVSDAPGSGSLVVFSSRGFSRMTVFDQVPRPPFIDLVLFAWVARFQLNTTNRQCLLEPWLLGPRGQQGTYFGQPVNPEPPAGWDTRTTGEWSPDGTKVLAWEARGTSDGTPADPAARILVADLPARKARVVRGRRTPNPTWAPSYAGFHGYLSRTGTFTVHGRASGTAIVTMSGNAFSGAWSVTFHHYSDDGRTYLEGTEAVTEPSILTQARWQANLVVSGRHTGSLTADLQMAKGGVLTGTVTSTYDGTTTTGLPPSTCAPLPAPQLAASATSRAGVTTVQVRARVPEDPVARSVRDATVQIGGRTVHTDARGTAVLRGAAGDRVQVRAAGFTATTVTVGR